MITRCMSPTSGGTYATSKHAITIQSIRSTSNVCIVRDTISVKKEFIIIVMQ